MLVRLQPPELIGRVRKQVKRPGREPGDRLWVRFPPRLLWTLESDGQAAGCNPVQVGSIPTGVSYRQLEWGPCSTVNDRQIRQALGLFHSTSHSELLTNFARLACRDSPS
jgi:hypothetical protein